MFRLWCQGTGPQACQGRARELSRGSPAAVSPSVDAHQAPRVAAGVPGVHVVAAGQVGGVMRLWWTIVDGLAELAEGELRWRREHPDEWAAELRDRELRHTVAGRPGLARVAARRAARWERRARRKAKVKT